jgi:NTP pyrophosphatase (non-canonical NTP hydrolase)
VDREQTLETLIPYLIDEAYEFIDALHERTVEDHREELGDLLLPPGATRARAARRCGDPR